MNVAHKVEPPTQAGILSVETVGSQSSTPTSTVSSQAEISVAAGKETTVFEEFTGIGLRSRPAAAHRAPSMGRVLIADDSHAVRETLARQLLEDGFDVVLAIDGQDALDKFFAATFDLVLLDLEMPVRSGWDAFGEMVERKGDQVIILLTEHLDSVDLTTTGPTTRVAGKPLHYPALLSTMKKALATSKESRHSVVVSQQNLARYAKPYVSPWHTTDAYDHWGIND